MKTVVLYNIISFIRSTGVWRSGAYPGGIRGNPQT